MPQLINISTEYRNKLKNGSSFADNPADFTTNLTGNVMEENQCIINCSVEWFANADLTDNWNVDAVNNIITRTIGSFELDGFAVGQKFRFISDWSTDNSAPNEFEGVITFIRQDGKRLDFSLTSGAVISTGSQTNVGIRALGNATENYLTGLVYRFGFVENDDNTEFNSLVTGNEMSYQAGGIPRIVGNQTMNPVGTILDWQTGGALVSFISESDYVQSFRITHTYKINPWFREGETENTKNNIPPNEFAGANSLKHVFNVDFRKALSNPNISIQSTLDSNLGSVGFYDENYNGLGNNYTIESIAYQDVLTTNDVGSLQTNKRTRVTIEISKISGSFVAGERAGLFVSLLASQSVYQDKTTTLIDNFIYDSIYHNEGGGTTLGLNVIRSITSSIVSGNLIIVAELEYNTNQRGLLSTITNPNYVLAINLADDSLTNEQSDRVVLKEIQPYIVDNDVEGLISFSQFDFHFADSEIGVDTGFTDHKGWVEDSLAVEFTFSLNLDVLKQAFLNTIGFTLVAYNETTGETFSNGNTFFFNLSNAVVSGGSQQIEIDTTRNYLFVDGNQYNKCSITTGAKVGDNQNYSGVFAQKVRWEDWLQNRFADTVFYDSGQPQNGLNFKSSNYSDENDYTIRVRVSANVSGLDDLGIQRATIYNFLSPPIEANNYDIGNGYTCEIELFRASNNALIGTPLIGEDTLIRATFTATAGAVTDLTGFWSAIKMQPDNQNGQQISELSINYIDSSGLLKPKDGFSFLDMQIVSGNVVCECLIDGDKVDAINYNITARINAPSVECFVLFMNGDCAEFMNGDLAKFLDQ